MENKHQKNSNLEEFCRHWDIQIPHIDSDHTYGKGFAFINPGQKDPADLVSKIWRKLAEEKHDKNYINNHTNYSFNLISDCARYTVIIPSYREGTPLIEAVLKEFGGELTFHDSPKYKAVHHHTQYHGVNLEIQWQTIKLYAAKKHTDKFYHDHRDKLARNPEYKNNPRYIKEAACIEPMLQSVYENEDFGTALPNLKKIAKQNNQAIPPMNYENFLMLIKDSYQVQKEFGDILEAKVADYASNLLMSGFKEILQDIQNESNQILENIKFPTVEDFEFPQSTKPDTNEPVLVDNTNHERLD